MEYLPGTMVIMNQMKARQQYSLGLSSFSLLRSEAEIAARILIDYGTIDEARRVLKEGNLFQRLHRSTSKVAVNEVLKRLTHADDWELDTLAGASDSADSAFICMLLVSRQYRLLLDLVVNLILYKFEGRDLGLETYEIISWYTTLSETHEEIHKLKEGSFKRLVNNTKRILVEGGMLDQNTKDSFIVRQPRVSFEVQNHYENKKSVNDLHMLLLSDQQIKRIMEFS
jgi:hypothetical protein